MHCSCNDEDRGGRKSNLTVAGSAFMGADYRVGHFSVLDTGQFGEFVVNTLSPRHKPSSIFLGGWVLGRK